MSQHRPRQTFFWIAALSVVAASALLWWLGLPPLYAYLVAINAVTLLLYGYDKRQAVVAGGRVPEVILHLAALVGGSAGALIAQILFRHKTRKFKFRLVFVGILALQVIAVFGYGYFFLRAA